MTTGEQLYQILINILGTKAHIIHPDASYEGNAFEESEASKQTIFSLASHIFEAKCSHLKNRGEGNKTNPPLTKPVIMIINTQGKANTDEMIDLTSLGSYCNTPQKL